MLQASRVAEWWVSVADNCMNDGRTMPIETETCVFLKEVQMFISMFIIDVL